MAEALIKEQRKAGVDAWLLFLYGPPSEIAERYSACTICLKLPSSKHAILGITYLRRAIRRVSPDLIHCHDGIIWPRLALLNIRLPVVLHSHLPVGLRKSIKETLGWILIKKTTDHLIGISEHTAQTWLGAGFPINRVTYIPNGVDFSRFVIPSAYEREKCRDRLGLPQDKTVVLWVGRLHQSMKGSDRVERLAAHLPDHVMLVVVGHGPDYEGMRCRCAELIDIGKLFMAGLVCHPEEYYKAADAFLFTSYHEPFGLVILEAVASGLPILSFPVTGGGGAIELLEEFQAVQLEDCISRQEVAEAIDRAFGQMNGRKLVREQAYLKYSWMNISQQVVKLYNNLFTPPYYQCSPRILHVCQRDDMRTGGATRIAFDLVVGQRRCGADAHLVFLYGKPGALGWKLVSSNCVHYLGLGSATEVIWKGWGFLRLLSRFNPDVVHHHDMLLWSQVVHARPHRYKLVYHAHLDYTISRKIKPTIAWWLIRRNTDVVITPTDYGKSRLRKKVSSSVKISVVPNGTEIPVHTDKSHKSESLFCALYGFASGCVVLGWGGRLHCGAKGTDQFIRLFSYLPHHFVGIIAGQGPDEMMLKRLVKECGLERRVFFHGLEQNMDTFYQGVDAVVLTSHFESFGLVVIEALANQIPVFALPARGGINRLFDIPGVYKMSVRSVSGLAQLILKTLEARAVLYADLEMGYKTVERSYSIERMALETLQLYGTSKKS